MHCCSMDAYVVGWVHNIAVTLLLNTFDVLTNEIEFKSTAESVLQKGVGSFSIEHREKGFDSNNYTTPYNNLLQTNFKYTLIDSSVGPAYKRVVNRW